MTAIFTIKKSALRDLNAEDATQLFRGLLWCEVRRIGLSPHNVIISLDTNVADGGIDACVTGNVNADSILVKGTTRYQVKAGHRFKPWQLSALKKELFGKSTAKPSKKILAPEICDCLNKKDRYVLITFGYDLTPSQQSAAKEHLTKLLQACGYRAPKVDVFGQGQVIGQLSLFPSLSLAFQNKSGLSFRTVEEWKAQGDMVQALQLSDDQARVIKTIREELRGTKHRHLRLIGEPGLGKTRLALEALTAEDLAPQALYVLHAEDFQRSQLFNELLRKDAAENVTLVIDECSEKERASIWNSFRERENIRLLTIDHGPEQSRDDAMMVLDLPRLPDDQIKAILGSYVPKNVDPSHWVAWCEGSPRVAHAVGENLKSNPEDLLKPPATVPIWERFIAGYDTRDSQSSQETLTILRHIALFTKFGFEDPVAHEAKFIWQLIQKANSLITWERFQELVARLRQRRILQGKRTLFIVPKALHIHLWINYWDTYGRDFSFVDFFAGVPSQLQNWFLQFFIYGHASSVARDTIGRILSPAGPFSNREFLISPAGTRFINYLAEADPGNTLTLIERTFGNWSIENLLAFKEGRQDIVWALEKIAVWKEYFPRATKMLIKLALAENSNYGNNSTGVLRELFRTGLGWAATQSPPVERFAIINELLRSQEEQEVGLGLSLCEEWLSTGGGFRIVGAEYQGLRPELEFWKPKIWKQVFDAWLLCWKHLWSVSRDWQAERRQLANRIFVDAGLELVNFKPISAEIMDTLVKLAEDDATDRKEFTHRLIGKLRFRSERLPRELVNQLRALDKKLTGQSFWERFCRFVLNTNWDEDYTVKGDKVRELSRPSLLVKKLVAEVVREPTLLSTYLPKIVREEGHRLPEFGRLLATKVNQESVVREIISAQLDADLSKNTQFIGGYFSGFRAQNSDRWESFVQELLRSERTRALGITIVLYSGRSESVLRMLLQMFRSNAVDASVFNGLAWEAPKAAFPPDMVEEVLQALVNTNNEQSLRVAIDLADYYFFNKEDPRSCDEQLLFNLVTAAYFFRRDNNEHHHYAWYRVTKGFRERFPHRDIEVFKAILSSGNDLGIRHSNYPAQIADAIARDHPADAWAIISKNLESEEERSVWLEMWLGEAFSFDNDKFVGPITAFDPESVIAWVMEKPAKRTRKLLRCLPKTLDEDRGGKLTRLFVETVGDGELGDYLMGHFWTGGWSGPESAYLAGKRDKARDWVSQIKSGKTLAWLYRYIEHLNDLIAQAEMREERGF
jgi:hypothetical protein